MKYNLDDIYCYNEPIFDDKGNLLDSYIIKISVRMIIEEYWDYWQKRCFELKRYTILNVENCIEDFIVTNWAWKKE